MKINTLEKIKRCINGFYDLFQKTIRNSPEISVISFIVTEEFNGRIDLISKFLYGTTDYIEELMVLNNIINPYSIKSGDIIYVVESSDEFKYLYDSDKQDNNQKDKILNMNKSKSRTMDTNRTNYPPTIKPDNLKQLNVNYKEKKITIINKFK